MVSFAGLTLGADGPIYYQIIRYIQRGLVSGAIRSGEELPSRRALSALLGVNPNTIQKAYRLLEEQGLIQSRSGAKSFVSAEPELVERVRSRLLEDEAGRLVAALRQTGASKPEALALVDRLWDECGKREEEE